jgi:hypothetical protein
MKTALCAFSLLCVALFTVSAQDTIPNGSFEYWTSYPYKLPTNYTSSSNVKSFQNSGVATVERSSTAYHGSYAIKLTTVAPIAPATDTTGGYFSNSTNTETGDPTTWPGGIPYTQIPTGIRGYYTYNVNSADSALVGVVFKKNGVGFAHFFYAVGGIHSTYTPFEFTFTPALTQAPDSIIFVATSSNLLVFNGLPGSIAKFDSISFTGASQPLLMNGDFESWTNYSTPPTPNDWFTGGGGSANNPTFSRTTDANVGTYALELNTIADTNGQNKGGTFQLNTGNAQDGQWINNSNTFTGGFPCNLQQGKLTFYYKYTPANPKDSATINISFKNNGVAAGGAGMNLKAASSYTYVEIPFNNFLTPDSAMIQMSSSYWQGNNWQDTAYSYVGAVFKIDGLVLQATSTGVTATNSDANITFYPNPMKESGVFDIPSQIDLTGMSLHIYNVTGVTVKIIPVTANKIYLSKGDLSTGLYNYEFTQGKTILKKGKIVVE